tara:strand:- start:9666 stop:9824 length:159 start_codon:yes stop_codon:yes gene_type:complete
MKLLIIINAIIIFIIIILTLNLVINNKYTVNKNIEKYINNHSMTGYGMNGES